MSWPYIVSIAGFIVACFSFIYLRSYINKKTSYDSTLREVRDEVNRIIKNIDEITDKDISLIEDREKRLKEILEDTEKRLGLLTRELDRRETAEKTYREMGKNPARIIDTLKTFKSAPSAEPALSPAVQQASPPAAALPQTAALTVAAPQSVISPAPQPAVQSALPQPAAPPAIPLEEQIRELARSGFPAQAIASRLGISIAEAEFAVALQMRREE
ncbi:MAG: hypothetical protein FWD78_03550 [Treponema sp.]|nr:hypothetical protein [Treponema sp.]